MKIEQEVKSKQRFGFVLADATPAYANALRRSIVSLVPTMAIEDVEIYENSSALYDEVIAHRLGLLPLITDLDSYQLPSAFPDDGVSRAACEVKMSLEAKGPCIVLASEIKSKDPKVKCAYPEMPIIKLLKGQALKFEATAVLGRGKVHAKWTPAAVHYFNQPFVIDGDKKTDVLPKDVINEKVCEIFVTPSGTLNIPVVKAKNPKVSTHEDRFIFMLDCFGQLKPEVIIAEASKQLVAQIDEVAAAIKKVE